MNPLPSLKVYLRHPTFVPHPHPHLSHHRSLLPPQNQAATIGPSISIKGDISGNEDLLIEGRIEGAIELRDNNVTVGSSGRVTADIRGKRICIDGEVTGDLFGDEILIRKSGQVNGNARAPRVTLDNGCHFRGNIDMRPTNGAKQVGSKSDAGQPSASARREKRAHPKDHRSTPR